MKNCNSVLIVEDNEGVRIMLEDALTHEGYTNIHKAENGLKALNLIDSLPRPTLVLLDIQMPLMDGHEFFKQIEEKFRKGDLPIVIITATSDTIEGLPCIRKPSNLDTIFKVIDQTINP